MINLSACSPKQKQKNVQSKQATGEEIDNNAGNVMIIKSNRIMMTLIYKYDQINMYRVTTMTIVMMLRMVRRRRIVAMKTMTTVMIIHGDEW